MILSLYAFLITISLVLIVIGLVRPSESFMALVGFFFLFLLSFTIMNGNLEYETGANVTTNVIYGANNTIASTEQIVNYGYNNFNDDTSFNIGLYLAIISGVGFAGVMFSLKNTRYRGGDDD